MTSPVERVVTQFQEPFSSAGSHGEARFSKQAQDFALSLTDYRNTSGKVIILGDAGVGKTSLIQRYCYDLFESNYKATIGVDFEIEKFQILGRAFSLQLWDTAGNERFRAITRAYFRGANCVILAFDMSEARTLDNVRPWFADAQQYCNSAFDTFVVGCKLDRLLLVDNNGNWLFIPPEVKNISELSLPVTLGYKDYKVTLLWSPERYRDIEGLAMGMAHNVGGEFWPTSSLSGDNLENFFQRVACVTFERVAKEGLDRSKQRETVAVGSSLIDTPSTDQCQTPPQRRRQCCQ